MKKVFALWLLSLWFVAVAYSDETRRKNEKSICIVAVEPLVCCSSI